MSRVEIRKNGECTVVHDFDERAREFAERFNAMNEFPELEAVVIQSPGQSVEPSQHAS